MCRPHDLPPPRHLLGFCYVILLVFSNLFRAFDALTTIHGVLDLELVEYCFAVFFELCISVSLYWLRFDLYQCFICCGGSPSSILLHAVISLLGYRMSYWIFRDL